MKTGCSACEVMVGIIQNRYPLATPGFKDMLNLRIIRQLDDISNLAGCTKNLVCLPLVRLQSQHYGQGDPSVQG